MPGAAAQELHSDSDIYPFRHLLPPALMPVMWALTDFTADNGSTQLVPGSHRWEKGRPPLLSEITAAEMPAGSAVVYLGNTIHGGGNNVSKVDRTGLALQYPQRLLQPAHDGPRNRSNAEVDELAARMHRHRWGDVRPVPTHHGRRSDQVAVNVGPLGQHEKA